MWLLLLLCVQCIVLDQVKHVMCLHGANLDKPLYLTPLLDAGRIPEAQSLSRVTLNLPNVVSYSGFFTVNKTCESNLFFWFFQAQKNWNNAPVLLWLQGGPGISTMPNVFEEIGPITYKNGRLGRREYSWNVENNLIFIEQPVGTGFSFTNKGCYAENETVVGEELYTAMVQFFKMFPELNENNFFIAGHSYAGHFIPALGHSIHKNNPTARVKINLKGMMIGNGWMDALYQYDVGSYLYQLGLIDDEGRDVYYERQNKLLQHLKNQEWQQALEIRAALVVGDIYNRYVGNVSVFNYLEQNDELTLPFVNFIQTTEVRRAIHVGNVNFSLESEIVGTKMGVDPVLSVKTWVEELLEHYFIVFYTGQLDIICGYPMTVNFLKALNWGGKSGFKMAKRQKWCVGDKQAGAIKGMRNLYEVFVRNAPHAAAYGQPLWVYKMINSATSSPSGNPLRHLTVCSTAN